MIQRFHARASRAAVWPLFLGVLLSAGCGQESGPADASVRGHLEGQIRVRADVDSTQDYRGFEVLVYREDEDGVDTLGFATTDSTGRFAMPVVAPERGLYSLVLSRRGTILRVEDYVVAEGDSATLRVELPAANRPLTIRSQENAAWMAYRNTKALHDQELRRIVVGGAPDASAIGRSVEQTSAILWSLRDTYPRTLASELAAAESAVMLEGWNDSLLVERAATLPPDHAGIVEVARAVRRATARREGLDASVAYLRGLREQVTRPERRAALQAEIVLAYQDSLRREEALEAAGVLQQEGTPEDWQSWAEGAAYELENLMPGMPAPAITATTADGAAFSLDDLRGAYVVLEFFSPADESYRRQLPARAAFVDAVSEEDLRFVSVSLDPDSVRTEALWESFAFPGVRIIAPGAGADPIARAFNVGVSPTRYLIDREGKIVGRYVGNALPALREDVLAYLQQPPS